MGSFHVHLDKERLVFSAAHFITFNGNICERLHGHNWGVRCDVEGELDENRYVFDFIALRDTLAAIADELDHRVLLPETHAQIKISRLENEVEARFEERRWLFPAEDCVILPVTNTTAEEIARWFARQLAQRLGPERLAGIEQIRLGIDENFGQWAVYSARPDELLS